MYANQVASPTKEEVMFEPTLTIDPSRVLRYALSSWGRTARWLVCTTPLMAIVGLGVAERMMQG